MPSHDQKNSMHSGVVLACMKSSVYMYIHVCKTWWCEKEEEKEEEESKREEKSSLLMRPNASEQTTRHICTCASFLVHA